MSTMVMRIQYSAVHPPASACFLRRSIATRTRSRSSSTQSMPHAHCGRVFGRDGINSRWAYGLVVCFCQQFRAIRWAGIPDRNHCAGVFENGRNQQIFRQVKLVHRSGSSPRSTIAPIRPFHEMYRERCRQWTP